MNAISHALLRHNLFNFFFSTRLKRPVYVHIPNVISIKKASCACNYDGMVVLFPHIKDVLYSFLVFHDLYLVIGEQEKQCNLIQSNFG
jgi:hypothetical protein